MNINKNVSVWRGNDTPPTQFHLWQKGDKLYHNSGLGWEENKIDLASIGKDGLMSKEDKERLDSIVYDGLDSEDDSKALSAKQGNILLNKIQELNLSVYQPKGSINSLDELPIQNLRVGDVYNIINPFYIEDLRYPAGTNVVWTGSKWDPLGGTVDFKDYSTTEQVEEMIKSSEDKVGEVLKDISLILYNQHSNLEFSVTPTTIEERVPTQVQLDWQFYFNSIEYSPDSITIQENNNLILSDISQKHIIREIDTSTTYTATALFKGIPKTITIEVNSYLPMYFGSSELETLTDITTLSRQPVQNSPDGKYNISIAENTYVWWCVPQSMNITGVESEGFEVPIEEPIIVNNYKCYRSTNRLKAGTMNCVIYGE